MKILKPRITKGRESTESASAQALLPQSHLPTENLNYVYAAMNFILCQHQSRGIFLSFYCSYSFKGVNYHRFIMRQLVKLPDCDSLHIISGNNSMVTGSYRHALGSEIIFIFFLNLFFRRIFYGLVKASRQSFIGLFDCFSFCSYFL